MPETKPTKSPTTRLSRSSYSLQANTTATHSRPKWHPIVRGLIPRTLLTQLATYSRPKSSLRFSTAIT
ncbi:hypothetical protein O181_022437 [Austropuccinia psidii MF-1]|uniref:Uncharacterized protein n=1 Tax=Austropuccinia psidii MF-1 TaxID=1389203 RepID=A0A9Q3CFG4_9BASI|nr:hypothetical protein [Austropuccinia psidii MF-1]